MVGLLLLRLLLLLLPLRLVLEAVLLDQVAAVERSS